VAQRKVLQGDLAVAAAEDREESKQVEQEGDHRPGIVFGSAPADQSLGGDAVLAKDRPVSTKRAR